ncbi:MAG: prenyltransferase/squalene oxidase repeat-containing protein [Acidobacteriota bacterium]
MSIESTTLSHSAAIPPSSAEALARAGAYLMAHQSPDGTWCDFRMKLGVSDAWTSGFVGCSVLALPESLRPPGAEAAVARAATWLAEKMNHLHGWSYNDNAPIDADSCANVVLFLAQAEWDFPRHTYARLLAFQREDGGFCTFVLRDPEDTWGWSHPCVTPVVTKALIPVMPADNARMARAFDAILAAQQPDGTWPSYWWESPLYSTAMSIETCLLAGLDFPRDALIATLEALRPTKAFDLALLLHCLAMLDRPIASVRDALLDLQGDDGSWPSAPILQLPSTRSDTPWNDDDPWPLFDDQNRLFTTSTAIRALVAAAAAATEAVDSERP